jgi:hypothetical protein
MSLLFTLDFQTKIGRPDFKKQPERARCCLTFASRVRASLTKTSPPAQPRDEGACSGELLFIKRCVWRMASIAHRFERGIDLAERGLGHGGVPTPLGNNHQKAP